VPPPNHVAESAIAVLQAGAGRGKEEATDCLPGLHALIGTHTYMLADGYDSYGHVGHGICEKAFNALGKQLFGADHPDVAANPNSLAQQLHATNRQAESEPLLRQHVVICRTLQGSAGYERPHMQAGIGNYTRLLEQMGLSPAQVEQKLAEVLAGAHTARWRTTNCGTRRTRDSRTHPPAGKASSGRLGPDADYSFSHEQVFLVSTFFCSTASMRSGSTSQSASSLPIGRIPLSVTSPRMV
jgi:hypothetical protein